MLVNHLAKRHPDVPYNTVPELTMPIVKTSKDYYCQYCDKVYKSSSKRKAHIIKNHPGKIYLFKFDIFNQFHDLKISGKSLPPSNRSKQSIQQSSSPSSSSIVSGSDSLVNPQTYSATVGSITINPHFCDWCHKQYASKAKLMQHQRKKHPDKMQQSTTSVSPLKRNNKNQQQQQQSNDTLIINNNSDTAAAAAAPGMYKFNTVITENGKATFHTVPISTSNNTSMKSQMITMIELNQSPVTIDQQQIESPTKQLMINHHHHPNSNQHAFLSPTEDSSAVYLDDFTIHYKDHHHHHGTDFMGDPTSNVHHVSDVDIHHNHLQHQQQQITGYTIDSNSFEDLMNLSLNGGNDDGPDVNHNTLHNVLPITENGDDHSPFSPSSNVITILGRFEYF